MTYRLMSEKTSDLVCEKLEKGALLDSFKPPPSRGEQTYPAHENDLSNSYRQRGNPLRL